jgi:capsid protein
VRDGTAHGTVVAPWGAGGRGRIALEEGEQIDRERVDHQRHIAEIEAQIAEWSGPPDVDAALDFYNGLVDLVHTNLGNGPVGTGVPGAAGDDYGTIVPDDVIGPAGQGIDPSEFDELVDAIRAGATYAKVHTEKYEGVRFERSSSAARIRRTR